MAKQPSAGIASAPFFGTVKTMTTTPLLSLGTVMCLSIGLMGCKILPFSAAVETQAEITHIPDQKSGQIDANAAASQAAYAEPVPERPYMEPPLIPGYKDGDPLFSDSAPVKVKPLPAGNPTGLAPMPNPASLPVLEQQPGVTVPLVAPDSVTKNIRDGLYYKAGEPEPYTGSAVLTYPNGQRKFEGFFKNGLRDGPCVAWYANGKKHYEGKFRSGQLYEGFVNWHYADSLALKMRGYYEKGRMVRGTHWDRLGEAYR